VAFSSYRVYHRGLPHRLPFWAAAEGKDIVNWAMATWAPATLTFELGHKTGILIFIIDAAKGSLAVLAVPPISCPAIHHTELRAQPPWPGITGRFLLGVPGRPGRGNDHRPYC